VSCSPDIGKKFFHYTESNVARHGEAIRRRRPMLLAQVVGRARTKSSAVGQPFHPLDVILRVLRDPFDDSEAYLKTATFNSRRRTFSRRSNASAIFLEENHEGHLLFSVSR
jgi:hypothetical protein